MRTSELQQARQRLKAFGRQTSFLVIRTSSGYTISLWHQKTQKLLLWTILLWWRPANSHHSILLIFRRSLLLRLSVHHISALYQAWTYRKLRVHLTKILLGQLRKIKSNRPLNPKQSACVECFSWSFKKTEEKGLPGSNSVWHSIRYGFWPNFTFRWRFDRRRGIRLRLCVLYRSFLWRPQCRRVDTMCEMFQIGANLCVGMEEDFVCEPCQG